MYSSTRTYQYTSTSYTYKFGEKGSGVRRTGEIQDFDKLRDKHFSEGSLFEDPTFDAVDSSIYFSKPVPPQIKWKRPGELVSDPHLFVEGVSRFDVVQGELGDCWMLAAISNITLIPALFYNVVSEDQGFSSSKKYAGIFHFRFWQCGKWIDVVVDDRLPVHGEHQLAFLHSKNHNEFWSALLEKAYAKLYGSYEALKGGKTNEALADFTGGVTETFLLKNLPPKLFSVMRKAHERSSLMGCSIIPRKDGLETLPNGLQTGHAYSITDVKEVDIATGKVSLLRIRNPWGGSNEWKGAWSDESPEWKDISESEKKSLGLSFASDGEFWMSFQDFMSNFDEFEVCHFNPDMYPDTQTSHKRWESRLFEGSWVRGVTAGGCINFMDTFPCNPQYRIVLDTPDDDDINTCTVVIALMQKSRRSQRKMGKRALQIGFRIYLLENPDSTTCPLPKEFFSRYDAIANISAFTPLREVSQRFHLPPGTYCIVPSTFNPNEEEDFLLRVYSEKKNDMREHDKEISTTEADVNAVNEAKQSDSNDRIKEAFRQIAGEETEIDANVLKEVLDHVLKKEFDFSGFSINLCRGMVAMMDSDRSGRLGFEEFKELWLNIATWKGVFKLYDKTHTGSLNSFELRDALASAGYHLNRNVLKVIILRYANKNYEISFEDFIVCAVKLKTMIEAFKERDKSGSNETTFKLDEVPCDYSYKNTN